MFSFCYFFWLFRLSNILIIGSSRIGLTRAPSTLTLLLKLWNRNFRFDRLFLWLIDNTYWATDCMYICVNWACRDQIWCILGLEESNMNVFESFADLCKLFTFTHYRYYLSYICNLMLGDRSWVPQYTACTLMQYIIILPHDHTHMALFLGY